MFIIKAVAKYVYYITMNLKTWLPNLLLYIKLEIGRPNRLYYHELKNMVAKFIIIHHT